MPRIRTIKPEFWEDERIGALSPMARLLFIGTWNLADDEGRLRWSPDYINASLFMHDGLSSRKVKVFMDELEEAGRVVSYQSRSGQPLAFIPKFATHQRINRPQPARYPPPPDSLPDSVNGSVNDARTHSPPDRKGRDRKKTASSPRVSEDARKVAQQFWESSDPKPLVKFVALLGIVDKALKAGWKPEEVLAALPRCRTVASSFLEGELKQLRGTTGGTRYT